MSDIPYRCPGARVPRSARDTWDYRSNFMDQNYVFPANFAQVMTDHVYIHTVIPTGVDRASSVHDAHARGTRH